MYLLLQDLLNPGIGNKDKVGILKTIALILSRDEMKEEFHRLGGVSVILKFLKEDDWNIAGNAFYILGYSINQNKEIQMRLTTEHVFEIILKNLKHGTTNHRKSSIFLIASVVDGNIPGQILVRESGCLYTLTELFHKILQTISAEQGDASNCWSFLCTAIKMCVHNPQNIQNQHQTSLIIPKAITFIDSWFHQAFNKSITEHVDVLVPMLATIIMNNPTNQLCFAAYTGIQTLIRGLNTLENWQDAPSNIGSTKEKLILLLDAAVRDNVTNCEQAISYGVLPLLLKMLRKIKDEHKFSLLTALTHLVESSTQSKREFVRLNGITAVVVSTVNISADSRITIAANCLLKCCVINDSEAEGGDVFNNVQTCETSAEQDEQHEAEVYNNDITDREKQDNDFNGRQNYGSKECQIKPLNKEAQAFGTTIFNSDPFTVNFNNTGKSTRSEKRGNCTNKYDAGKRKPYYKFDNDQNCKIFMKNTDLQSHNIAKGKAFDNMHSCDNIKKSVNMNQNSETPLYRNNRIHNNHSQVSKSSRNMNTLVFDSGNRFQSRNMSSINVRKQDRNVLGENNQKQNTQKPNESVDINICDSTKSNTEEGMQIRSQGQPCCSNTNEENNFDGSKGGSQITLHQRKDVSPYRNQTVANLHSQINATRLKKCERNNVPQSSRSSTISEQRSVRSYLSQTLQTPLHLAKRYFKGIFNKNSDARINSNANENEVEEKFRVPENVLRKRITKRELENQDPQNVYSKMSGEIGTSIRKTSNSTPVREINISNVIRNQNKQIDNSEKQNSCSQSQNTKHDRQIRCACTPVGRKGNPYSPDWSHHNYCSRSHKPRDHSYRTYRGRRMLRYSEEELKNLVAGVSKYGLDFKAIRRAYTFHRKRTSKDLYLKWRNSFINSSDLKTQEVNKRRRPSESSSENSHDGNRFKQ
ncbi:telomere repeats-binding bouquet formation protein 1-like isoform X2 [Periplaneta americana]